MVMCNIYLFLALIVTVLAFTVISLKDKLFRTIERVAAPEPADNVENFSTSHGTMMQLYAKGPQDTALTDGRYRPLDAIPTKTVRLPPNYVGWYPYKFDYRRSSGIPTHYQGRGITRPQKFKIDDNYYWPGAAWPQLVGTNINYAKWQLEKREPDLNVVVIPDGTPTDDFFDNSRVYLFHDTNNIVTVVPRIG